MSTLRWPILQSSAIEPNPKPLSIVIISSGTGVVLRSTCAHIRGTIPIREIEVNSSEVLIQDTQPTHVGAT